MVSIAKSYTHMQLADKHNSFYNKLDMPKLLIFCIFLATVSVDTFLSSTVTRSGDSCTCIHVTYKCIQPRIHDNIHTCCLNVVSGFCFNSLTVVEIFSSIVFAEE